MADVEVSEVVEADEATYRSVCALLPQLSSSFAGLAWEDFVAIVASPSTRLLVAVDGADVVGALTLVLVRLPTGLAAHVEDVVVDKAARGHGAGRALVEHALALARAARAGHVDLTSRPSRTAANALYRSLGFEERATNTYRYEL